MSLYENHKKIIDKEKLSEDEEVTLVSDLDDLFHDLDADTEIRLRRYRVFSDFFHGKQWGRVSKTRNRDQDRHKYTINWCEPAVTKYATLLGGSPPRVYVPGIYEERVDEDIAGTVGYGENKPNFEADDNRSDALEKKLRSILYQDNPGAKIFYEGAKGGSLYGDTIFFSSFDREKKTFLIQGIFPGYFRARFSEADFTKIDYVFLTHIMSLAQIKRKFGVVVEDESVTDVESVTWNPFDAGQKNYAVVKTYWDEDVMISYVGNKVLKKKKHGLPGIPFFHIPNRIDPYNPWGLSDLTDIIELQERLNIAASNQADLIELYANPKIVAKGLNDAELNTLAQGAQANLIPIGRDADLSPFEYKGTIFPIQNEIADVRRSLHEVSGLPEVLFGQAQGSIVTGVALTAQAAPTLQIINAKLLVWLEKLGEMASFMLKVLEKQGGLIEKELAKGNVRMKYADIIDGNYKVVVRSDIRLPRDDSMHIQNQINMASFGLQSKARAMEQVGIENPDDEQMRVAYEKAHPLYNPEGFKEIQDIRPPESASSIARVALEENNRMAQGEEIEATAPDADGHALHLELHDQFDKDHEDLPPEIRAILDKHMAGHELAMSKLPNVPQEAPEAPPQAGQTAFPTMTSGMGEPMNPMIPEGGAGEMVNLPPVPQSADTSPVAPNVVGGL